MTGVVTEAEIFSQPEIWRRAADLAADPTVAQALVAPGERVLAIGCGTSAHVALAYAVLREQAGLGLTDYAFASELPGPAHDYDRVLAFSRSGTTTEIVDALEALPRHWRRVVVTGVVDSPVAALADDVVDLGFADETSVVQTRFPTATLIAVRVATGELDATRVDELVAQAEDALAADLPDLDQVDHVVYLGTGWALGIAHEAALKVRESALAWAESYPSADYRHGPLAVAGERSLITLLGGEPDGLAADVAVTGAQVRIGERDPLAELVLAQRVALQLARLREADPDTPRHLTRSVVLSDASAGAR
jgi:glucosamine--fructose-6-phosphate aminotransferase (isomerizing)